MKKEKACKSGEVISMLEQINDGVVVIGEQRKTIVNHLNGINGRLGKIEGNIDVMKSDIVDIKHDLREKVDRDEFNKMEKRVIRLEKLVFAKPAR